MRFFLESESDQTMLGNLFGRKEREIGARGDRPYTVINKSVPIRDTIPTFTRIVQERNIPVEVRGLIIGDNGKYLNTLIIPQPIIGASCSKLNDFMLGYIEANKAVLGDEAGILLRSTSNDPAKWLVNNMFVPNEDLAADVRTTAAESEAIRGSNVFETIDVPRIRGGSLGRINFNPDSLTFGQIGLHNQVFLNPRNVWNILQRNRYIHSMSEEAIGKVVTPEGCLWTQNIGSIHVHYNDKRTLLTKDDDIRFLEQMNEIAGSDWFMYPTPEDLDGLTKSYYYHRDIVNAFTGSNEFSCDDIFEAVVSFDLVSREYLGMRVFDLAELLSLPNDFNLQKEIIEPGLDASRKRDCVGLGKFFEFERSVAHVDQFPLYVRDIALPAGGDGINSAGTR